MRLAGDYFGISLTDPDQSQGSTLLNYFPDLRKTFGNKKTPEERANEPQLVGGASSLKPFGGFKPTLNNEAFGKTEEAFGGFKASEASRSEPQSVKPFAGFKKSGY